MSQFIFVFCPRRFQSLELRVEMVQRIKAAGGPPAKAEGKAPPVVPPVVLEDEDAAVLLPEADPRAYPAPKKAGGAPPPKVPAPSASFGELPGCCHLFPGCGCLKARWSQRCQSCGFPLKAGTCAEKGPRGWKHKVCYPVQDTSPGNPDQFQEGPWYVVFKGDYAVPGIYLGDDALREAAHPGRKVPPIRSDKGSVLPFDSFNEGFNFWQGQCRVDATLREYGRKVVVWY